MSKGFGADLTPSPWAWGGGPKTLKAEGNIFENCLKAKEVQQVTKLTRAGPGTSASV